MQSICCSRLCDGSSDWRRGGWMQAGRIERILSAVWSCVGGLDEGTKNMMERFTHWATARRGAENLSLKNPCKLRKQPGLIYRMDFDKTAIFMYFLTSTPKNCSRSGSLSACPWSRCRADKCMKQASKLLGQIQWWSYNYLAEGRSSDLSHD